MYFYTPDPDICIMHHTLEDLSNMSLAELAAALADISAGVTQLDLSLNDLCKKTGADLATAFAGIPASVTQLDLSCNALGSRIGAELAKAFAGIPASVRLLDLSDNDLGIKTGEELAQALAGVPATVINIRLGRNFLFHNRTHQERDNLLMALARVNSNPVGRLDLSGNGESEYQRAILPMISLVAKGQLNNHTMSQILSYERGSPPANMAVKAMEHQAFFSRLGRVPYGAEGVAPIVGDASEPASPVSA